MIFEDDGSDEGSGWSKWWLLGAVLVGLPLLALGLSSVLGGSQEKTTPKSPEALPPGQTPTSETSSATPAPPVAAPAPVEPPQPAPPAIPDVDHWTRSPNPRGGGKQLEDRRDTVRLPASGEIALKGGEKVSLVDLSPWGLRVSGDLTSRNLSEVVYLGEAEFPARLVWTTSEQAGFRWQKPEEPSHRRWLGALLHQAGYGEGQREQRREWTRVAMNSEASLEDAQDRSWSGVLLNLSMAGACLRADNVTVKDHERVRLIVPTGKRRSQLALSGVIVEQRGNLLHVRFLALTAGLRKRLEGFLSANLAGPAEEES